MDGVSLQIRTACAVVGQLKLLLDRLADALDQAEDELRVDPLSAHSKGVQIGFQDLPEPSDHRRNHRPGRPSKIETDPELRAFIEARIDRMTFDDIASEVSRTFPEGRRVAKSAIHAWWQRRRRR
ncbi:hypothetical protein [Rhodovulum visakhapatnamense]|uniref:Uncharacterized protein n=1 Tax=Rhodovulum visakhapatnamense TaxID=364297 RepID=A0A4R8G4V2_9RHOB|nr:hypothetical protein [Rhodovulum visakhapatnamense]TDX30191.1 hypothetical protein EV657_107162 [Rhodovulum visakhapatnamense]